MSISSDERNARTAGFPVYNSDKKGIDVIPTYLIASHFNHEKLVQIQFVEYACFRRIDPADSYSSSQYKIISRKGNA
jgi:hypothetical protein